MKINEIAIIKQIVAAILFTQGTDRIVTHMIEASEWLHSSYPKGTRYFLVRSVAPDHSEWLDSVYWLSARCIVVSEKEIWQTTRADVISGLLDPILAK